MTQRQVAAPLRTRLGTLILDRPFLAWPALLGPGFGTARRAWVEFRNRGERLVPGPAGRGFSCDWRWTSRLTLPRAWPRLGVRLLHVALAQHPVVLACLDEAGRRLSGRPVVSFVIGHRGRTRLPHLLTTVRSIIGQSGPLPIEIVVVEQDVEPFLSSVLPPAVRVVPLRPRSPEVPYSRSWAFNVGVREAAGEIVVLHDNDTLVSLDYAKEIEALIAGGWDGARLQRLMFYLDDASTRAVLEHGSVDGVAGFDAVVQNSEGGTIALRRDAYHAIGGHDEAFVGWGGEDNEFFDRCQTLRFFPWGFLPLVHLKHPPQPGAVGKTGGKELLSARLALPREDRARECREREWGMP